MIIFYNKTNGEIIGTVDGRVHTEEQTKVSILPDNIKPEDVGKYIIPLKENFEIVDEPIKENRVIDKDTMRVEEVVIGIKKVKKILEMTPDVSFAPLIKDFEEGKDNIHKYKIKLNKKSEVEDLIKKNY